MVASRVAVVGGGLAGIAAATRLHRLGHSVDLFERSRLLGGKATSFQIDGLEVDNGQHVFLGCCKRFIKFVMSLERSEAATETWVDRSVLSRPNIQEGFDGMASRPAAAIASQSDEEFDNCIQELEANRSELLYLQPRFEVLLLSKDRNPSRLRAGRLPAPLHLLPALWGAGQLSMPERVGLGAAFLFSRRSPYRGETFLSWLHRHFQGSGTVRGFWEPFVVPALNASLEEVSAAEALFVVNEAFLTDRDGGRFGYARVPLARIAERAVSALNKVHMKTPVRQIEVTRNRFEGLRMLDGTFMRYDGAVVAVPPRKLKTLLERPADVGVFGLDQFQDSPIVDVHLWFKTPSGTVLDRLSFAALLGSPVQWVFEKPAPGGETYLCCSLSAAYSSIRSPSEKLISLCEEELKAVLPLLRTVELIRSAVTRDNEATFVPKVGLLRPGPTTSAPNLVVAGAWTDTGWPATMESAIRSGESAATVLHSAMAA